MKRLSRQMVPYLIAIWVAFLALSGMTTYCDLQAAEAPHSHAGESVDHNGGDSIPQHLGDTAAAHDHDSSHPHCCHLSNAEYVVAKVGVLADTLRIPTSAFLLASVDAGLSPRQAEAFLARSTVHPPPPKQALYLRIQRFLI